MFASEDGTVRRTAISWIGRHDNEISAGQTIAWFEAFLAAQPDDVMARSLRNAIADRRLASLSREERARLYWMAVREGSVDIGGSDRLLRSVALGRAAVDGLEEFEPAIRAYGGQPDIGSPFPSSQRSEELIWYVRLRTGARDRRDAERLHAERLAQMDPEELADRMTKDLDFQHATMGLMTSVCEKYKIRPPCVDLARAVLLQNDLANRRGQVHRELGSVEQGKQTTAWPSWLEKLHAGTEGVRTKLQIERAGGRPPAAN
jgi:hypothetical protein